MTVSHLQNLDINIFLDSAPGPVRGFSSVLHLVDGNNNSLNSSRFLTFNSAADAVSANTSGYIDAGALKAAQTAFTQPVPPSSFLIGRADLPAGGAETWVQGLDACLAAGAQFYGVTSELRGASGIANQILLGNHVESGLAQSSLIGLQVQDADWLTSGDAAAWATLTAEQRVGLVYHDDNNEYADVAWMVNRLAADPDVVSAPWDCEISGVPAYTTALTQAQKDFLYNDSDGGNRVNNIHPYGPAETFVDPGKNRETGLGRPMYEMVTRDWFEARLQERVAQLKVNESARFNKITIDAKGQAKVLSVIEGLLTQAQAGDSPHLIASSAKPEAITQADLDAGRLRFKVQGQIAVSARLFTFNVYFSRSALVT